MSGKTLSRWRCSQAEIILDIIAQSDAEALSSRVVTAHGEKADIWSPNSDIHSLLEWPMLNVLLYTADFVRSKKKSAD